MSFYNTDNWPSKRNYYRWPWSNNDNPVQWLEITDECNIHCKGCYRSYMEGHRPLETLQKEVDFCIENRNIDTVCIAGGEPLIYPDIVPLVAYIAKRGLKPNIITNAVALTGELARDLYKAGLFGFTCHIDMMQERPGVERGSNELDLMPLRQKAADLIYKAGRGRIYCTYNMTTYHENFKYIPDIIRWARKNIRKVNGVEFILYRGIPIRDDVEWDVEETGKATRKEIQKGLGYTETDTTQINIESVDVYNLLKDNFGDSYEPCSYLGGTGHIKEYKWWAQAGIMAANGKSYGNVGPRTMEFIQTAHHFFKGRYFMYLRDNTCARFIIMLTGLIGDKAMRRARAGVFWSLFNPINWFRPVYFQSIGINQPPDMLEDGTSSMCESCPDACVWNGNLVSSCRLDEYRKYGRLMNAIVVQEDTDKRGKKA